MSATGTIDLRTSFYDLMFRAVSHKDRELNAIEKQVSDDISQLLENRSSLAELVPLLPGPLVQLLDEIMREDADFYKLHDIITKDVALSGELIKLTNKPYYRVTDTPVETIGKAIVVLGMKGISRLATTLMMREVLDAKSAYFKVYGRQIWTHSFECAHACSYISGADDDFSCYLMGLVHDVGKIIIFKCLLDAFAKVDPGKMPESKLFRVLMTERSAQLSLLAAIEWELPETVINALSDIATRATERCELGDILYQGNIYSELHLLIKAGHISNEEAQEVITDTEQFEKVCSLLDKLEVIA